MWLVMARMVGDDGPGEDRFVVTRRGQLEAVCATVEALAGVVDIAELRPDEWRAGAAPSAAPAGPCSLTTGRRVWGSGPWGASSRLPSGSRSTGGDDGRAEVSVPGEDLLQA